MTLLGLDLNATRARAVQGAVGDYALALPLDPPAQDLPMLVSLEKRTPEVGRAGLRHVRNLPHLTYSDFLAQLGDKATPPRRGKGRLSLDAGQAMTAVWQRLTPVCQRSSGVVVSLPPYLLRSQADLVRSLGSQQKIPILGSLPSLLAVALAGYAEQTWVGSVLVMDIDEHGLSMGLVRAVDNQANLIESRHFPRLGLRAWQDRLINALADCCVLQSRRDPRDVPSAEQALFEQIDALLDAGLHGRTIQLGIQAPNWYQNLLVHPEQASSFCAALARQVVQETEAFCQSLPLDEVPDSFVLTAAVGRLPGLALLLRSYLEEFVVQPHGSSEGWNLKPHAAQSEDFGDGLLRDANDQVVSVAILPPEAAARGAHSVATHFHKGDLQRGHLELAAPLPLPQPAEAGPARLHFQGQDFFLTEPSFVLGSQLGCHMHFDMSRYPAVAPRHCEILFDHRTYLLFNRSRDGTLVNDAPVPGSAILHAGDWIRLGPGGPALRFLGRADGRHKTA